MRLSWLRRCEAAGHESRRFITLVLVAFIICIVRRGISETEAPQDITEACYGELKKSTFSLATPFGLCGILIFYGMLAAPACVPHLNRTEIRI
jgi:hypothetical protein